MLGDLRQETVFETIAQIMLRFFEKGGQPHVSNPALYAPYLQQPKEGPKQLSLLVTFA